MRTLLFAVVGVLGLNGGSVLAQNAMGCVDASLGNDARGQYAIFRNGCDYWITVFYCWVTRQDRSTPICGERPKFYSHNTVVGPGATDHVYHLRREFRYAACRGNYGFGSEGFDGDSRGDFSCSDRR